MNEYLIIFLAIINLAVSSEKIEAENNDTCGGTYTETSIFLKSPSYPEKYPPNLNCVYIFQGPSCPSYYKFDIIDFELENSVGCVNDRLLIGNQDVLCGKVEGNKVYFKSDGSLNVKFSTNNNTEEKGFKIFVTRMPCERKEETTTEVTDSILPTTIVSPSATTVFRPLDLPDPERKMPQCCWNIFNSRRFLITSPHFPYSLKTRQECVIRIQKSNKNICRLRLTFLFFWLGSYNYNNCPYGYIKIDGKFICGCNKELKLITAFEDEDVKELVYRSEGVDVDARSGFVIEVIQDECPSKYHPKLTTSNFTRDNNEDFIEQAQLLTEKTEILNSKNNSDYIENPRLIKSFYFFKEKDYNSLPLFPNETETTTFVDTSTVSIIVTNTNQKECTSWNKAQIDNIFNKYGSNLQTCEKSAECRRKNEVNRRSNCVELDYIRGYFKSPGYPFFYPKLLNMCFRFRKQPGYCFIKLYMTDFQLESSYGCRKDYLLLENRYRYCGRSLLGQYRTFDLTYKNYEDLIFVTDFFFCGRGFYGIYEQLPCHKPPTPFPPTSPRPPTPPAPTPDTICDRYIPDQLFILEVNQNKQKCVFEIRKFSEDACKVVLHFEKFDLFCGSETLLVNDMRLCGHLTGRKFTVNFDNYNEVITIIYQSNLLNKHGDFKFKITGEQITDDCLIPDPPAQLKSPRRYNWK